jgi:5-formyltetrahydrofolate cyclo-ligase
MSKEAAVLSWDEIRRWRKERRADLIARRQVIPQAERRRLQPLILGRIEREFPELAGALVGFYWPIRGEIGAVDLIRRLIERGARAALPVVVEKNRPLEFRAWRPGDRLERGVWNIPIPAARQVVRPTALLVPLVGFDRDRYRLGYGGGYYDRTLAALDPRPLTIGVGFELGRLSTIHPQPHDVPMDAIVTEAVTVRARSDRDPAADAFATVDEDPNSRATYASPPCFMHELDPSYLGFASDPPDRPDGGEAEPPEDAGSA